MSDRWATFDCYGTLIDWNLGISRALGELFPGHDSRRLLALYHEAEPVVEAPGSLPYREVLAECTRRIDRQLGIGLANGGEAHLARSLPDWPPFPEVPAVLEQLRESGWRIAVLSNIDPDLLETSIARIGVTPDLAITHAEAGSYKPAPGHWETFFRTTGADRARHAHVAASLFHDIVPCARMGVRAVWINRLTETSEAPRAAELGDLEPLPGTLENLVAP